MAKRKTFDTLDKINKNKRVTFSNNSYDALVSFNPDYSSKVQDSYSNVLARLGVNTDNILNYSEYVPTPLDDGGNQLTTLYRYNWVVRNLIEAVPNDITKRWFKVRSNLPPDELDKIEKVFRETNLRNKINEGMRWGRLYGGAIGIIIIDGQSENLDEPLQWDMIVPGSFKGLYIVDRYRCSPSLEINLNLNSKYFGLPLYYDIFDSTNNFNARVHQSKVIRFLGRPLPIIEKQREMNWGGSEVEAVYRELIKRDSTSENIASLIFKASLSVHKIKNLDQIFSMNSVQAQNRFWSLMESISTIESNMGTRLIDSEDDVQYMNYSFAGIKDVYEGIMMDLSGACRIPATKLFGRSPAGMNATGESDLQNYYDYIDEVRESQFREQVGLLLPLIGLSTWGKIPNDLDFEFEEMASMDESQKTQIVQQKTQIVVEAFNSNLITQDVAQKELKNLSEKYGMFDNITDEMIEQSKGKYMSDLQGGGMGGGMGGDDPMMGMFGGGMGGNQNAAMNMNGGQEAQDEMQSVPEKPEVIDEDDEIGKYLMDLKHKLMSEGTNKEFNLNDLVFSNQDTTQDVDTMIGEHQRLSKLQKKIQKDFETAEMYMWSYPNKDAIPLAYAENYNRLKNQFNNIASTIRKLEQDIINAGGNLKLLESRGELEGIVEELNEDIEELKQMANVANSQKPVLSGGL